MLDPLAQGLAFDQFHDQIELIPFPSARQTLHDVRMAEAVSQVYPISQASGWRRALRACADGHDQRSRFQKRVEPMTVLLFWLTIAKGMAVRASRQARATLM